MFYFTIHKLNFINKLVLSKKTAILAVFLDIDIFVVSVIYLQHKYIDKRLAFRGAEERQKMLTKNQKVVVVGVAGAIVVIAVAGMFFRGGKKAVAQPAPVAEARPITDVECENTYQFDQVKRFRVNGEVLVNFHFGGKDRGRQPQYITDRDVLGFRTEMSRNVDRSLKYSTVSFVCLSDRSIEGHKASNVQVMRYRLNLRRPLVAQKFIPEGGPSR